MNTKIAFTFPPFPVALNCNVEPSPVAVCKLAKVLIFAVPLNETPLMFLEDCKAVAVAAFPVKAPEKVVAVTVPKPLKSVTVWPNSTSVDPIVTLSFVNAVLGKFVIVLLPPLIVLFVTPCDAVSNKTVPVAFGSVTVWSAFGSATVKVVSKESSVAPSNFNEPVFLICKAPAISILSSTSTVPPTLSSIKLPELVSISLLPVTPTLILPAVTLPVTLPVKFPVTLPVTFPSKFPNSVAAVYEKFPISVPSTELDVEIPTANLFSDSSNTNTPGFPVEPLLKNNPISFALDSLLAIPLFSTIKLSSIVVFVVLTVVVVPLTVRFPVTIKSFPTVTSFGKPIVKVSPEIAVSISFEVPETFNVSPSEIVPIDELSSAILNEELTNSALATPPSLIVTAPELTLKLSELNEATPLFDVEASSPETVKVAPEIVVSIPSPPVTNNVWPKSIEVVVDDSSAKAIVLFVNDVLAIFVIVLSGPFIVLLVNVSEPSKDTKSVPTKAVLKSLKEPETVLLLKLIVLFSKVSVPVTVAKPDGALL